MDDWALERESELVRLEYENYELRRMVGIPPHLSPPLPPPDVKARLGAALEGDRQHINLAMSSESLSQESGDDLALLRQQSHTQGQMQISLDGELQSQSQTLGIPCPSEAPLVTRKYGRRTGCESGSFIGSGNLKSSSLEGESGTSVSTEPVGAFLAASVTGTWPMNVTLGPGERSMNIPPSGNGHNDELSTPEPSGT
jgi:hypothetical protein